MSIVASSPVKQNSNKTKQRIMTPHGNLTLRKLASIKIVDKCSCYVIGLDQDVADSDTLSGEAYFGQFGQVLSVRVLQNKDPAEVYIRFNSESAAESAIQWCSATHRPALSADHGYQKYCMKFIKNKQCHNFKCPNRHSWCKSDDTIIIKKKLYKAFDDNIPMFNKSEGEHEADSIHSETNAGGGGGSALCKVEELNILQQQFMVLQCQYNHQNHFIQDLLLKMQEIKTENQMLRDENVRLHQQMSDGKYSEMVYYNMPEISQIESIVDSVIQSDDSNSRTCSNSSSASDSS